MARPRKKVLDDMNSSGLATGASADQSVSAQVKEWQGVIARCSLLLEEKSRKEGWDRVIKEYKGDWTHIQSNLSIPLIPLNLIFAYCKTEISRLYFRDPWISVNPKRMEDLGAARIAEQLLNYVWSEIDLKRQFKLAILDAELVGHGWIKVGYTAQFGTVESKPVEKAGNAKKEPDLDTNEYVKSENVFGYHIPWNDVLFDPSAVWPPESNARWMAFKTIKPLSVVRKSKLYKNPESIQASELTLEERRAFGNEGSFVVIWEIWDKENGKVFTITPNHPDYLRDPMEWPYQFDGFPAVMVAFNPIPGDPYPLSDVTPWEGQVVEATKMMAIMLNHLKRWNRQIFMKRGMVTDEMKAKFKNSEDGALIEYEGNQSDLFVPPYAAVQQDIYGVWNLIMDIFRNVSGQSEVERGATAKSNTRTLGELQMAVQGSRGRSEEKVDIIEGAIEEVARKLLAIMQQKFDLPKIVRLVGQKAIQKAVLMNRPSATEPGGDAYTGENPETGQVDSFSVTRKDIHGEMDVSCVAGSSLPLNKENQIEILQKMAPNLEFIGILPGSKAAREYGRELLRQINMLSLDRIMDVAEEEAQQPKQDPEMLKIQAELQGKQMDSQLKMQQTQAKMQADQASTQMDLQAQGVKTQMELAAEKAKLESALMKAKADMQKIQMQTQARILESLLGKQGSNGGGSE